ncbi:MAG: glycosyltransferase family 4 protein [Candidatus Kapabacteria bacterium]|nr:glycosyltransferase family 4 protein [Candidatus Kapabacteria bacterium]
MATILHIIDNLGTGGAQTILAQICSASTDHGDESIVVALRKDDDQWFVDNAGSSTTVIRNPIASKVLSLFGLIGLLLKARRVIRDQHVIAVHSHLPISQLFAIVLRLISPQRAVKWCTSVYGTRLQVPMYFKYFLPLVRNCNQFLFSILQDYDLAGSERDRCVVIKVPFTSTELYPDEPGVEQLKKDTGICSSEVLVLGVTRFTQDKLMDKYEPLFAYLSSMPNCRVVFVGAGDLHDSYRRKAVVQGWGNVHFPGIVRESTTLYRRADIMITLSINSHYSVAALNAAACGCIVVSLNLGSQVRAVEIIDSAAPQYLKILACDSQTSLLSTVSRLIENSELRNRIQQGVRARNEKAAKIRNLELYYAAYHNAT